MKNIGIVLVLFLLAGCASGEAFFDDPKTLFEDPHFAAYKEKRDALEIQYLNKEITYAEYVEQKKKLDDQYDWEVRQREQKLRDF